MRIISIFNSMKVQKLGAGPVNMVFAPGGPGLVPEFYRELMDVLSDSFTVTQVSFSGTHPEPAEEFPRTMAEAADELEAVVAEVSRSPGPTIVLGHSYGGAVAIEALLRTIPVDGTILISSFPSGRFLAAEIEQRVAALPDSFHRRLKESNGDSEVVATLTAEYWFPKHLCTMGFPDSFQAGLQNLNPDFMNHVLGSSILKPDGAILEWDRESDLHRITSPVLVLGGPEDYFRPEAVRTVYATLPNARFVFPHGASHSAWIENPDETIAAIQQFVKRCNLHET
jgi:L-proline amide hydrolase